MFEKGKDIVLGIASKLRWFVPLLARLVIGAVFIQTGWGKLHDLEQVVEFFNSLGIPEPELQAPFVAVVELVGGLFILLGFFTRLSSLPLICTMGVAIVTAKLSEFSGPLDLFGTQEFDYIVLLLTLFVFGAGPLSIDQLICKRCAGTVDSKNK